MKHDNGDNGNNDNDSRGKLRGILDGLDSIGRGGNRVSSDRNNSGSVASDGNEVEREDSLGIEPSESGTESGTSGATFNFGEPGNDDGRTTGRKPRRGTRRNSGSGRTVSTGSNKRATAKASLVVENEEDIKNFVVGCYSSAAMYTGFEAFKVTDDEALTIARPASRLLARNTMLSDAVFKFSDPVSLLVAVVALTAPRVMAYKWMAGQMVAQAQAQAQNQKPPQPSSNGTSTGTTTPPNNNGKDMSLIERMNQN